MAASASCRALVFCCALFSAAWAEEAETGGEEFEAVGNFTDTGSPYPWYLVDTPAVVCSGVDPDAPGKDSFHIDFHDIIEEGGEAYPHVITIFRLTNETLSVTLEVKDAEGRVVVPSTVYALIAFGPKQEARRLGLFSRGRPRIRMVWHTRRYRAGAGAGGHRAKGIRAASASQSFGYSSDAAMRRSFAGGIRRTDYGLSGMCTQEAILAASLGESGRTAAEVYKRGRMRSSTQTCLATVGGNKSQMSCRACVEEHGDACRPEVPRVANRDDLMATAFWPEDYASPLKVSITAVSCVDLDPNTTCRAAGTQQAVLSDIFVSLTRMQAVRSEMMVRDIERKTLEQKQDLTGALIFVIVLMLAGVVACLSCVVCVCRRIANGSDDEYGAVESP